MPVLKYVTGESDYTGFDSIRAAAERRYIDPKGVEWIIRILECRASNNKDHQRLPPRGCLNASFVVPCYR
jgi:hypothetical protein